MTTPGPWRVEAHAALGSDMDMTRNCVYRVYRHVGNGVFEFLTPRSFRSGARAEAACEKANQDTAAKATGVKP